MAAPEQRDIDWASAEVEDATLTVELTGVNSELPQHEEPDTEKESEVDEAAKADRQMTVAFRVFADD